MVMLGAILQKTGVVSIDSAMEALKATFGPKKEHLLPINRQAMEKGAAAVANA
jgi:2-oxoglutarate ferredoxin oxidoreductase subunit gamma